MLNIAYKNNVIFFKLKKNPHDHNVCALILELGIDAKICNGLKVSERQLFGPEQ
jgi:hypothetical protein